MTAQNIAKNVATALGLGTGETWTAEPGVQASDRDAYVTGPDGLRIHLSTESYLHAGRLVFVGTFNGLREHMAYDHKRESFQITVSPAKSAERIASDIIRRLLPQYRETMAETLNRKVASDDADARREALITEFTAAWGRESRRFTHRENSGELGSYSDPVHAEYRAMSEDVEFTVRVSADRAVRFAELLAQLAE